MMIMATGEEAISREGTMKMQGCATVKCESRRSRRTALKVILQERNPLESVVKRNQVDDTVAAHQIPTAILGLRNQAGAEIPRSTEETRVMMIEEGSIKIVIIVGRILMGVDVMRNTVARAHQNVDVMIPETNQGSKQREAVEMIGEMGIEEGNV